MNPKNRNHHTLPGDDAGSSQPYAFMPSQVG